MSVITLKAGIKTAIEAATGADQTIFYTAKGQPCYFNKIPKFDMSIIDASLSGTHPAFIVNGVEKDFIYVGTYHTTVISGEAVSQPYQIPTALSISTALATAKASNPAWRAMSNSEYMAAAFLGLSQGGLNLGCTSVAGVDAKGTYTASALVSGAGGATWRANNKYDGVSDLTGLGNHLMLGVRMLKGELQVLTDFNAASYTTYAAYIASENWKAIDAETGAFITPTFTGTIAAGDYVPTTEKSVRLKLGTENTTDDYTLVHPSWTPTLSTWFVSTTKPVLAPALNVLKHMGIYPSTIADCNSKLGGNNQNTCRYDEKLLITTPFRGGGPNFGISSGIFYVAITQQFDNAALNNIGSRLVYIP